MKGLNKLNTMSEEKYNLEFFWDPICPFAWMTSRWLMEVKKVRQLEIDWRFICLWEVNSQKNYDKFPEGYVSAHQKGRDMLRVAAAVRREHGRESMELLYTAFGESIWNRPPPKEMDEPNLNFLAKSMSDVGMHTQIEKVLEKAGLPTSFAEAAGDESYDKELAEETQEALSRTGKDVGTPIITYNPPDGPSLFGPVISELPDSPEESAKYFDALITLTEWKSFAEIKRSLRGDLKLQILGS